MIRTLGNSRGSILILAAWALSFLAVMAATLGMGARQKIIFIDRMESRDKLRTGVEAGVEVAIAVLNNDLLDNQYAYSTLSKIKRHNNLKDFNQIPFIGGMNEVSYYYFDGLQGRCFALMALLPRHKCVVKSGSSEIVERALKDGYIAVYA